MHCFVEPVFFQSKRQTLPLKTVLLLFQEKRAPLFGGLHNSPWEPWHEATAWPSHQQGQA